MGFSTITFQEPEKGIGLMTLNRPECLNALSLDMLDELHSLYSYLLDHIEIRVLIITGAGRGFCSGADLKDEKVAKYYADVATHLTNIQKKYADRVLEMRHLPQPIIAAVNGAAAGGGMCLALAADVVIADENASFTPSFVNIGLSGGEMGTSYFLPRIVGMTRASEILLTGRSISAVEAERIGIVNFLATGENLLGRAMETARLMLAKSSMSLRFTKETLNQNLDAQSLEAAIAMENRNQSICGFTPEFQEAIKAFRQKTK